jgi:uncharacterized protein YgiM (DUF1202 family)
LLLLVALICLLPITIKCIEIFTPRKPVTEASPSPAASVAPTASLPASEMQAEGAVASAEPAAAAAEVRVTANGVNLREQPSRQAPRVASLTLNQAVQLLEDKTQAADGLTWSKIQTAEGQVGWISAAYLSVTEAAAPASAAPTVASTANPAVAASAEPAESATLAPETPATAPASAPLSGTSARVSAEGVSLRSGPSVSQALLLTLPAGAVLELLPGTSVSADNLEWVQVKTQNGKTGWMARKFLAP